jgi:hypothetical protein
LTNNRPLPETARSGLPEPSTIRRAGDFTVATIHSGKFGWVVVYYNDKTSNWQTYTHLTLTEAEKLAAELNTKETP